MKQKKLSEKQIQRMAHADLRVAKKQYHYSPSVAAAAVLKQLDYFSIDLGAGISAEELKVCVENGTKGIVDIAQNLLDGAYELSDARKEVQRRIRIYRRAFEEDGIQPLQIINRGSYPAIYC